MKIGQTLWAAVDENNEIVNNPESEAIGSKEQCKSVVSTCGWDRADLLKVRYIRVKIVPIETYKPSDDSLEYHEGFA